VTRLSTDRGAVEDEVVTRALEFLREQKSNAVYVADVARAAGVTRRVLELRFRRALNTSVHAEAQRLHFEHARSLLAETGMSVSEIAYASGFESITVFSSAFRRQFKMTPSAYRESVARVTTG
jgi:LacI family transcriptional regulator